MSVKIVYFAHGATNGNDLKKSTGWSVGAIVELSERGIKQNEKAKEETNISDYDIVFTSDFSRAVDTAKQIFDNEKEIIIDERLRECNYGDLNGQDSFLVKYSDHIREPFPNGESLIDVEARMKSFCDYLLHNFDGKTIALVTHKTPNLALEVLFNGKTWEQAISEDWRKYRNWISETYMIEK